MHRILCALHAMLGRALAKAGEATAVVKPKSNAPKPRSMRRRAPRRPEKAAPAAARTSERKCFFDCDIDELRKVLPRSPEQEEAAEAERWWRSHSRMGWRR